MRSGNGRHRRPRQAPAIVVAAGVTGSAMALPLLATGSASAADAPTWDRVAECESGGAWSANFGNGLYGGLQFTQESWERHGGLAYAPSADLASRAQQIAIADKALAAGDTQWATCAPIAGLQNDGRKPAVVPGPAVQPKESTGPVAESNRTDGLPAGSGASTTTPATPAAPAAPATPSAGTATAPATPAGPATPDASVTPGKPDVSVTPSTPGASGSPEASDPAAPGTGKHRGDAAPEESGNTGTTPESGRHAAPTDGATGGTAATDSSAESAVGAEKTDKTDNVDEYTVKPGDSLSDIAQENALPGGWTALYDANKRTVGADPDLILPGQSLELTPEGASAEG